VEKLYLELLAGITNKKIILDRKGESLYNMVYTIGERRMEYVIYPPNECPCCDSILENRNGILYCVNSNCVEQQLKLIENFGSKMKIKGLGPSTVRKLGITQIHELYELTLEEIIELLESEKLATKLFEEITKSHDAPLNLFLPALGIPLIGNTVTNKLACVCSTLADITVDRCELAGIGPKTRTSLLAWKNSFNSSLFPQDMKFTKQTKQTTLGVVCITGKLTSYKTKAEATKVLNELGYDVKSTVTKDVTILVNESGIESAKVKKARASGVTIITTLSDLIGD
jgi:DNA ligase (NAD+)